MPLSATATREAYAQESGEAWIVLLTIAHPDLPVTDNVIRVASEGVAVGDDGVGYVDSDGARYLAYPFEFELPSDTEGEAARARITIDNIGTVTLDDGSEVRLLLVLRGLSSPPTLTVSVVLADDPDIVEHRLEDLTLLSVSGTAATIEGELAYEDTLNQEFPALEYTPRLFPGLFP